MRRENFQKRKRWKWIGIGICVWGLVWGCGNWMVLQTASEQPLDSILVLGGSIRREIYAAEILPENPSVPVLISGGSQAPCIWELFRRTPAPLEGVWLEECAQSTFDNFYFSLPILQRWQVHHLKLITSATHLPRAAWLAQIILGSHGIWVEVDPAPESGVPGNQEYWWKTSLDVIRASLWAVISHGIDPQCSHLMKLTDINLRDWCEQGFSCEHQGQIDVEKICNSLRSAFCQT